MPALSLWGDCNTLLVMLFYHHTKDFGVMIMTTQYLPENEIPRHRPSNGVNDYLALVSRPTRYIDSEVNSVKKDLSDVRLKFGLAFPDVYEVGMSHLGLQILYQILNSRPDIAC